jgi:hypothetical protein
MNNGKLVRSVTALGLLLAAIAVVVARPVPAAADAAGLGGDFVPIDNGPILLDTRTGTGGREGKLDADRALPFVVLGVGGVPASGVKAVLLKVAAADATSNTFLRLYPNGDTDPGMTMLTVAAGQLISNTTTVAPGTLGKVVVWNASGSTHVIVQVQGYFRTAVGTTGGGFVPVTHTKVVDTRSGTKIGAGSSRTFTLTGSLVPAGATAVAIGLCVPSATAGGYLSVMPAGQTPTRSTLNYDNGTTSSLAVVRLSAGGQIIVKNVGSVAVDVVIVMEGYFTASPSTGAGYRPAAGRVFDSRDTRPISADGTVEVQLLGRIGMPLRGVAGVVFNVTAVGPSGTGWLRVYPSGTDGTDPAAAHVHFNDASNRGSLIILKPGTDGKIRILNGGSASVDVVVDVQGYFADPIPVAPVELNAPTVGLQAVPVAGASLGMVEYAYTDNIGRVLIGHQTDVDNFGSVQWTVLSGNEAFSGRPSLAMFDTGRAQLSVRYSDSDIWNVTQTENGSATWNGWNDTGGSMAGAPTVALLNGQMLVFAIDADGKLWIRTPSGLAPAWTNLGDQNLVGSPVIVANRDGLQLFAVDSAGAVKTAAYTTGVLSAWTNLGDVDATGAPAVVVYPGYRMRVLVRQGDGTIATKYQDATGAFPAAWTTLGTQVSAGDPAAILDPVLGRTAVVTRSPAGEVMLAWETGQGTGVFGEWSAAIPDLFETAATDPTIVPLTNTAGQTWLILFRNANSANRIYERQPVGALGVMSTGGGRFSAHTLPVPPQS